MIKTAAVMAAFGLLVLTGCTQQLSTSETCVELKAIAALAPDGVSTVPEDIQKEFVDGLDRLAARSSDTMRDVVTDMAAASREGAKPVAEQDAVKFEALQERIDRKIDMVMETCNL